MGWFSAMPMRRESRALHLIVLSASFSNSSPLGGFCWRASLRKAVSLSLLGTSMAFSMRASLFFSPWQRLNREALNCPTLRGPDSGSKALSSWISLSVTGSLLVALWYMSSICFICTLLKSLGSLCREPTSSLRQALRHSPEWRGGSQQRSTRRVYLALTKLLRMVQILNSRGLGMWGRSWRRSCWRWWMVGWEASWQKGRLWLHRKMGSMSWLARSLVQQSWSQQFCAISLAIWVYLGWVQMTVPRFFSRPMSTVRSAWDTILRTLRTRYRLFLSSRYCTRYTEKRIFTSPLLLMSLQNCENCGSRIPSPSSASFIALSAFRPILIRISRQSYSPARGFSSDSNLREIRVQQRGKMATRSMHSRMVESLRQTFMGFLRWMMVSCTERLRSGWDLAFTLSTSSMEVTSRDSECLLLPMLCMASWFRLMTSETLSSLGFSQQFSMMVRQVLFISCRSFSDSWLSSSSIRRPIINNTVSAFTIFTVSQFHSFTVSQFHAHLSPISHLQPSPLLQAHLHSFMTIFTHLRSFNTISNPSPLIQAHLPMSSPDALLRPLKP